ncbi:MAG: nuclear transport factor 2 family protein [Ferruginibacter sp.]
MKKTLSIFMILMSTLPALHAQSKNETAVANAVEQLRKAMVDADSIVLDKIISPGLSYGHSHGQVEDKPTFIAKIISGKSDFVTLDLTEQTISVNHNTAIVRHILDAKTNDSGKPSEVHLKVLLVFHKERGQWKLLARQAVKPS